MLEPPGLQANRLSGSATHEETCCYANGQKPVSLPSFLYLSALHERLMRISCTLHTEAHQFTLRLPDGSWVLVVHRIEECSPNWHWGGASPWSRCYCSPGECPVALRIRKSVSSALVKWVRELSDFYQNILILNIMAEVKVSREILCYFGENLIASYPIKNSSRHYRTKRLTLKLG